VVKNGNVLIESIQLPTRGNDHLRDDLLAEQLNIARLRGIAGIPTSRRPPTQTRADQRTAPALLNNLTEHRAKIAALHAAGAEGSRAGHDHGNNP
jgi:hypothetical protein